MATWTHIESCDACGCNDCAFRLEPNGTVHRLCADSDLREMVDSYIETALWSSTDESNDAGGDPLDDNYGPEDIDGRAFAEMVSDCESFRDCESELLGDVSPGDAGHNFWLSRNGHGAGFFDSNAEHADELQKATKPYGSVNLYVHDGKVHQS